MAWYEDFFDGLYGRVLEAQYPLAESRREARLVKRLLKAREGQRVLDVPCGQGRLTMPLAGMGLEMIGLDRVGAYLNTARRAARKERLTAQFVSGDMREIGFVDEFDAAFNWFGSFGYFSDTDNLRVARGVFAALKPGGRFLVDGLNKTWLIKKFVPQDEQTIGGVDIRSKRRWNTTTNRLRDVWTFTSGERTEQHEVSIRIYNGAEIRSLLTTAGFRDIKLYGHPPLAKFTRHAHRWIAVASKPGGS